MARILVNYIYSRSKDEYKILDPECVYADQPYADLETEENIERPLVVPIKGRPTVVDRDKYESIHRIFSLIADEEGNVREDPNGTKIWLPKDTNVDRLKLINGQLVMIPEEAEPQPEPEQEKKEEAVKETKKRRINQKREA